MSIISTYSTAVAVPVMLRYSPLSTISGVTERVKEGEGIYVGAGVGVTEVSV